MARDRWKFAAATALTVAGALSGAPTTRSRAVLAENWFVKQIDTAKPDPQALTQEAKSPGGKWMRARMPAQVHDVLLEHG